MYLILLIAAASILVSILVFKNEDKKYKIFMENRNKKLSKEEIRKNYDKYLQTDHWKKIRKKALEKADNKCQLCSSKEILQVHHNTYENVGNEKLTDLVVLCRECHSNFHNKPY